MQLKYNLQPSRNVRETLKGNSSPKAVDGGESYRNSTFRPSIRLYFNYCDTAQGDAGFHSYRVNIFLQKLLESVYFMCMNLLSTCMAGYHVPHSGGGQKRSLDPLELELWMVVGRHRGAGN